MKDLLCQIDGHRFGWQKFEAVGTSVQVSWTKIKAYKLNYLHVFVDNSKSNKSIIVRLFESLEPGDLHGAPTLLELF